MPTPPDTRSSLIARLTDLDDNEAWHEFVSLYEPFIYRQARTFGLQDADARELVQDVLIAVSKALKRFTVDRDRGRFRTWLYAIGRNISLQKLAQLERGSGDARVAGAAQPNAPQSPYSTPPVLSESPTRTPPVLSDRDAFVPPSLNPN